MNWSLVCLQSLTCLQSPTCLQSLGGSITSSLGSIMVDQKPGRNQVSFILKQAAHCFNPKSIFIIIYLEIESQLSSHNPTNTAGYQAQSSWSQIGHHLINPRPRWSQVCNWSGQIRKIVFVVLPPLDLVLFAHKEIVRALKSSSTYKPEIYFTFKITFLLEMSSFTHCNVKIKISHF